MHNLGKVVNMVVMACLLLGVLGIAVGFFTGSSPTVIMAHGHLGQYLERLEMNRAILEQDAGWILQQINYFLSYFGI